MRQPCLGLLSPVLASPFRCFSVYAAVHSPCCINLEGIIVWKQAPAASPMTWYSLEISVCIAGLCHMSVTWEEASRHPGDRKPSRKTPRCLLKQLQDSSSMGVGFWGFEVALGMHSASMKFQVDLY